LMGQITGALFDAMRVPWEEFPADAAAIPAVLGRAQQHMQREQRPYALIMQKGTVAAHELRKRSTGLPRPPGKLSADASPGKSARASRNDALRRIVSLTPEATTVLIATTGYTGRELYALADRPNQLYVVGSMGCASSLALGLALARPQLKVVVVDGDGAALMRMGNFATIGAYGGNNLCHLVLDNEAHDSTGAQATVSAGVSFARIAQACGYGYCVASDSLDAVETVLADSQHRGPRLAHIKIRTGTVADLPRPAVTPPDVLRRLMAHIGTSF